MRRACRNATPSIRRLFVNCLIVDRPACSVHWSPSEPCNRLAVLQSLWRIAVGLAVAIVRQQTPSNDRLRLPRVVLASEVLNAMKDRSFIDCSSFSSLVDAVASTMALRSSRLVRRSSKAFQTSIATASPVVVIDRCR